MALPTGIYSLGKVAGLDGTSFYLLNETVSQQNGQTFNWSSLQYTPSRNPQIGDLLLTKNGYVFVVIEVIQGISVTANFVLELSFGEEVDNQVGDTDFIEAIRGMLNLQDISEIEEITSNSSPDLSGKKLIIVEGAGSINIKIDKKQLYIAIITIDSADAVTVDNLIYGTSPLSIEYNTITLIRNIPYLEYSNPNPGYKSIVSVIDSTYFPIFPETGSAYTITDVKAGLNFIKPSSLRIFVVSPDVPQFSNLEILPINPALRYITNTSGIDFVEDYDWGGFLEAHRSLNNSSSVPITLTFADSNSVTIDGQFETQTNGGMALVQRIGGSLSIENLSQNFYEKLEDVIITTQSLNNGTIGVNYSQTIEVIGSEPFTWIITGLPAGLDFNPSTGEISGVPENVVLSQNVSISVENDFSSDSITLPITIKNAGASISTDLTLNSISRTRYNVVNSTQDNLTIQNSVVLSSNTYAQDVEYEITNTITNLTNLNTSSSTASTNIVLGSNSQTIKYNVRARSKENEQAWAGTFGTQLEIFPWRPLVQLSPLTGLTVDSVISSPIAVASALSDMYIDNPPTTRPNPIPPLSSQASVTNWEMSGAPQGISINSSGQITGTPVQGGNFNITFTASSPWVTSGENRRTGTLSVVVNRAAGSPLSNWSSLNISKTNNYIIVEVVPTIVNSQTFSQSIEYAVSANNVEPVSGWTTSTQISVDSNFFEFYVWARTAQDNNYETGTASSFLYQYIPSVYISFASYGNRFYLDNPLPINGEIDLIMNSTNAVATNMYFEGDPSPTSLSVVGTLDSTPVNGQNIPRSVFEPLTLGKRYRLKYTSVNYGTPPMTALRADG